MNYSDPELQSMLAGEYVLGTLQGRARCRFERLLGERADLRQCVVVWQRRLAPMGSALPAQDEVSEAVWLKIQARLHHGRQPMPSVARTWNWWGLASTALAASLAAMLLMTHVQPVVVPIVLRDVAVLSSNVKDASWIVRTDPAHDHLLISALPTVVAVAPDKDLELWLLPVSGAPLSLGVIRLHGGKAAIALSAMQRVAFAHAQALAISIEPLGGSASGQPTGAVVYSGGVING